MKTITVDVAHEINDRQAARERPQPSEKEFRGALKKMMREAGMADHRTRYFDFDAATVRQAHLEGNKLTYGAEFYGPDADVARLERRPAESVKAA